MEWKLTREIHMFISWYGKMLVENLEIEISDIVITLPTSRKDYVQQVCKERLTKHEICSNKKFP